MRRKTASYPVRVKAAPDMGEGIFEAIVAVFDNVDLVGDRILKGAFKKSLERWGESGDPVPVIFNHNWSDLNAHVGYVLEAEERDEGLWVKAQLDMDEDYASRLWKKMRRRTIKELSFAYDVIEERETKDGVNELVELEIIEVGPTLKGANPETQLLEVKKDTQPTYNINVDVTSAANPADVGKAIVASIEDDVEPEPPALSDEDLKKIAAFCIKSGRVLSSKNETKLRDAHELIGSVLSSVEKEEDEPKSVEASGLKLVPQLVLLEIEHLEQAVNE